MNAIPPECRQSASAGPVTPMHKYPLFGAEISQQLQPIPSAPTETQELKLGGGEVLKMLV